MIEIPEGIRKEVAEKGGFEKIVSMVERKIDKEFADFIKTIADEKRLKIIYALGIQRMCVCMLAQLINCPYSKCSYHISRLKKDGIIKSKNIGNYTVYFLTEKGKKLLKLIEKIKEVIK
ncbi:MAG: winged helix-turn-helix transcriptional regulator [Thermoplasmatales archaeon]|nr:winged helix-turn-helix transcriptional regulator [Thermoplasmatales archaeon]